AILVSLFWQDIITGKILESKRESADNKSNQLPRSLLINIIINAGFLLILSGAIFYSYNWLGDDPTMPDFPQAIKQSGLLITGGAIWAIVAAAIALLLWQRRERWILTANLIGLVAFIIFGLTPAYKLVDTYRQLPLRQLAQIVVQQKQPGEEFMMIGFWKPSLAFYTQGPVTYYRSTKGAVIYIRESKDPPTPDVLVLGYPKKFVEAGLQPDEYKLIDSRGAYQLARVPRRAF
ncbi:MAG: glycosyltransferase, partial [Microcoleus sp.]